MCFFLTIFFFLLCVGATDDDATTQLSADTIRGGATIRREVRVAIESVKFSTRSFTGGVRFA